MNKKWNERYCKITNCPFLCPFCVLVLVLGSKGLYCCKYKLPKISRLLIHVDLHTIELSRTFHQVTHLLRNTTKIVLTWAFGMYQNTLWLYVKTHLCHSRSSSSCCCFRSDDCFESHIPREWVTAEDCSFQGTLETAVRWCQWCAMI